MPDPSSGDIPDEGQAPVEEVVSQGQVEDAGSPAAGPVVEAVKEPEGMLETVQAALKASSDAKSAPAESREAEPKPEAAEEADDGAELGEVTDDELKHYHSKTRRRIRGLLGNVTALRSEVEAAKPQIAHYNALMDFVKSSGLDNEDVDAGFEIMKLIRGDDPAAALRALAPYVIELRRQVGDILPDDLQEEVNRGAVSEHVARELASHRAKNARVGERTEAAAAAAREAEAEQAREAAAKQSQAQLDVLSKATNEWDVLQRGRDPDWSTKGPRVADALLLAVYQAQQAGNTPKDAAGMVALCNAALAKVNDDLRRFAPRPREVRHVPSGSVAGVAPVPQTMLEAARASIGGR